MSLKILLLHLFHLARQIVLSVSSCLHHLATDFEAIRYDVVFAVDIFLTIRLIVKSPLYQNEHGRSLSSHFINSTINLTEFEPLNMIFKIMLVNI